MEAFSCKTRIISGPGGIGALGELGSRRLLIVADPYFQKTDVPDRLTKAAAPEACAYFYEVTPDPSVELAARGTALVQKFKPDTVVALGGGSAMDCAKAMVYFSGLPVRLVAIPTTSGSGSEVTDFAVLTHGAAKHPLVDRALQPELAILDGDLLRTLPKTLIADAGFDIVTHAVEAYVATGSGAISDALAGDAFATVLRDLPASFAGDTAVRQGIHVAATMAGLAFSQAGLGLCHAMAHTLGGRFHVAHGRLGAILLPAVVEVNAAAGGKYAALARGAGLGGSADTVAVRNLKNALINLRRELSMPATLAQAGVRPGQVRQMKEEILRGTLADPCCATNPVGVEKGMVEAVLQRVTGVG